MNFVVNPGNLKALRKVLIWAKVKLTTGEINNKLLLGTDIEGKKALHWAELHGYSK